MAVETQTWSAGSHSASTNEVNCPTRILLTGEACSCLNLGDLCESVCLITSYLSYTFRCFNFHISMLHSATHYPDFSASFPSMSTSAISFVAEAQSMTIDNNQEPVTIKVRCEFCDVGVEKRALKICTGCRYASILPLVRHCRHAHLRGIYAV